MNTKTKKELQEDVEALQARNEDLQRQIDSIEKSEQEFIDRCNIHEKAIWIGNSIQEQLWTTPLNELRPTYEEVRHIAETDNIHFASAETLRGLFGKNFNPKWDCEGHPLVTVNEAADLPGYRFALCWVKLPDPDLDGFSYAKTPSEEK